MSSIPSVLGAVTAWTHIMQYANYSIPSIIDNTSRIKVVMRILTIMKKKYANN